MDNLIIPPALGLLGMVMAFVVYMLVMKYPDGEDKVKKIGDQILTGALTFMKTEYKYLFIFMAVIESEMYILAIVGLVTTVISSFYYIRIIKIMYFDKSKKPFEKFTDYKIHLPIILSCMILVTFFLYPSILNDVTSNINIF